MGKVIPVPALGDAYIFVGKKAWKSAYGKDLCWWTDNALFKHKALLISYYQAMGGFKGNIGLKSPNFREEFEIPKDVLVVGDSGGYTIYTKGIQINPEAVIFWQVENSDIAIALDVPFKRITSKQKVPPEEVYTKVMKTAENIKAVRRIVEDKGIKFFPVLHGTNKRELDVSWEIAVKPFLDIADGVCAAVIAMEPITIPLQVGYLLDKGIEKAHLLQAFAFNALPTYVFKDKFKFLAFDSRGFGDQSRFAKFISPVTLRSIEFGRKTEVPNYPLCECPACKLAYNNNLLKTMYNPKTPKQYLLLLLHNLYQWLQLFKVANYSLEPLEKLMPPKVKEAIEFGQDILDLGYKKAHNKWFKKKDLRKWMG